MMETDAAGVEAWHLRNLAVWSIGSMAGGAALWRIGRARQARAVAAFGRQNALWGAVDGAIAAVGLARGRRSDDPARAERLRRVLLLNAALDVGYMAAGAVAILAPGPLLRPPRYERADAAGDGAAIILQGGFLLVADLASASRLQSTGEPGTEA